MRCFSSRIGLLVLGFLSGCQSMPSQQSRSVFQNPAAYLGQQVRVCGNLMGTANLTERRGSAHLLGIWTTDGDGIAPRLVGLGEYGRVCLAGTIRYIGCVTGPDTICTDWAADYAVEVRQID